MKAVLRLECIGDDRRDLEIACRKNPELAARTLSQRLRPLHRNVGTGPWVARIAGLDGRGRLIRRFLDGAKDYQDMNGPGSRGIYKTYVLEDGIHEVHELTGWTKSRRYFLWVSGGTTREVTMEEVVNAVSA